MLHQRLFNNNCTTEAIQIKGCQQLLKLLTTYKLSAGRITKPAGRITPARHIADLLLTCR